MTIEVRGEVFYWRGPAPFYFVTVPKAQAAQIQEVSRQVSYGWGCIPCDVRVGDTATYTALFPKDGLYLVPLKAALRKKEGIEEGDVVDIVLEIGKATGARR